MEILCPHCRNICETECEIAEGQHVLCPHCGEKFSYAAPLAVGKTNQLQRTRAPAEKGLLSAGLLAATMLTLVGVGCLFLGQDCTTVGVALLLIGLAIFFAAYILVRGRPALRQALRSDIIVKFKQRSVVGSNEFSNRNDKKTPVSTVLPSQTHDDAEPRYTTNWPSKGYGCLTAFLVLIAYCSWPFAGDADSPKVALLVAPITYLAMLLLVRYCHHVNTKGKAMPLRFYYDKCGRAPGTIVIVSLLTIVCAYYVKHSATKRLESASAESASGGHSGSSWIAESAAKQYAELSQQYASQLRALGLHEMAYKPGSYCAQLFLLSERGDSIMIIFNQSQQSVECPPSFPKDLAMQLILARIQMEMFKRSMK